MAFFANELLFCETAEFLFWITPISERIFCLIDYIGLHSKNYLVPFTVVRVFALLTFELRASKIIEYLLVF